MVPRLNAGLALASDECVWNGDVGRGENGELGPLLTTVESDRRRRICLSLLLSTRLGGARVKLSLEGLESEATP